MLTGEGALLDQVAAEDGAGGLGEVGHLGGDASSSHCDGS